MDYEKAFGVEPETRNEDDWTEADDAAIAEIIKEIDELGGSEEGGDEDGSEGDGEAER